jgi:hypothetical protein
VAKRGEKRSEQPKLTLRQIIHVHIFLAIFAIRRRLSMQGAPHFIATFRHIYNIHRLPCQLINRKNA